MTVANDKGQTVSWGSPLGSPNGLLVVGKAPAGSAVPDFVLLGRESGRELFRLGTSAAENLYYIWYELGQDGGAWAGPADRMGAPGTEEFFVDPLGLVSLLGIIELPADLSKLPTVALSMSRDPCAYVLTYIDHQPGTSKIFFKREMYFNWSDQGARRPFQIIFFAPDGRRIMTAKLGDYKAVPGTTVGNEPAYVPTDITMVEENWPGRKSRLRRLHLTLNELSITQGEPSEAATFWDNLPPGLKTRVIMIAGPQAKEANR
jgi:hypothetical protein